MMPTYIMAAHTIQVRNPSAWKKPSSAVRPGETVLKAGARRSGRGSGGLVVTEGGRLVGIFTERDILRRVVAPRRDPAATKVADVMTTPVTACAPDTPVEECAAMMTGKRIRHLPVVTERGLAGVITIR